MPDSCEVNLNRARGNKMNDLIISQEELSHLMEMAGSVEHVECDTSYSTSMCVIGDCWGECRGN